MYSDWPCFMWIERISAVFLFVFSCMVLFSMQPYHKSLVTEMGQHCFDVVSDICIIMYVISNCCFTVVWLCNCQTDKIQEKDGINNNY